MGVCCIFYRLSGANLHALIKYPSLVYPLLDMDEPKPRPASGFFSRLLGRAVPVPTAVEKPAGLPEPRDEADVGDVDKAWPAIHFLLTGSTKEKTDHPLGFLCSGGTIVAAGDFGFGPPRAFMPVQVAAILSELNLLNSDILLNRFMASKLAQRRGKDHFGYVWLHYERMRAFIEEARCKNQGLLVYLW